MSEEIYFVEKILGHKTQRGKKFFLIKWIGYPDSDNSWEPQENLNPNLIIAYEANLSPEGAASYANTAHPAKKQKTKSRKGRKRTKKFYSAKTSAEELEKAYNLANIKELNLSEESEDSDSCDESNIVASSSTQDQNPAANIHQANTEELPKPKDRVEKIFGYSKLNKENGKIHLFVKFANEKNTRVVPHDEFRYMYPQELLDFYEKSSTGLCPKCEENYCI